MALKNPNLPRARLIIDACTEEPIWVVFQGMYRGYGRCGRHDNSLEGAFQSWLETFKDGAPPEYDEYAAPLCC